MIKIYSGGKSISDLKIISIGNLTVGGTGKTVFVKLLAEFLGIQKSAIVSRGYGSNFIGKNLLVCDGYKIFCSPDECGDEAYMLASQIKIVMAIGRDRYESCIMIKKMFPHIEYILLDDSYQNYQLNKNFEILMTDARFPMGFNGHCLPAGDLRESDYTRANLIILSHANFIAQDQVDKIKKKFFPKFDPNRILPGWHKPTGLFCAGKDICDLEKIKKKSFLLSAGIGSFSGLELSIKNFGININYCFEFEDHHRYTRDDVNKLIQIKNRRGLWGIIVTEKDWSKLSRIVTASEAVHFFVFSIGFEFLSCRHYNSFCEHLMLALSSFDFRQ